MTEPSPVPVIDHLGWRWYRLCCRDCGVLFPTAARRGEVPDRCPECRSRVAASAPVVEVCAVAGCSAPAAGRGWCVLHYGRWKRDGDPGGADRVTPVGSYRSPVELDMGWMDRANCLGCDPDLFFPERGEPTSEAKAVCAGCAVRSECLEFALAIGEKVGIWGGLSERERRRLRRARARKTASESA